MPTQNFKVGEMLNKRTPNSKTWMNFDGSYTTEIHSGMVHYEDESGNLHNINTDLIDEADMDSWDVPVNASGKAQFEQAQSRAKSDKAKNKLNRDLYDFQGLLLPYELKVPRNFKRGYTIGKGQDRLSFIPVNASPSKGYIEQNQATYQDVWNDADVRLDILPDRLKETIVLKTDRSPSAFSFEVKGNLADDLSAGELQLSPAWLVDAEGTERDVSQTVSRENNKVYVDLKADLTGLVYPIEIDPTVTLVNGVSDDTYVLTDNTEAEGTNQNLRSGRYTSSRTFSPVLNFDFSSIPSGSLVSRATMSLYRHSRNASSGTSYYMRVNRVTQNWDEASLKSLPSSIHDGDPDVWCYSDDPLNVWLDIDISNAVQQKFAGNTFYGIALTIPAGDAGYYDDHYSKESTAAEKPKITVTYDSPPTAPTITAPNGGETWNSLHTVTWDPSTDTDTAQSNLKYQIQLSTDNGATWKDIMALTTAGATSYDYDFINEEESTSSLIRIRGYDGALYGAWDQSDAVFEIEHNKAPDTPSNLSPSGGKVKNRAEIIRLSWQYNDPNTGDSQSKFDMQWREKGTSTWNTVTQSTPNQHYDAPAGTFPHGDIEWRVRTYDLKGLASPYSATSIFLGGDKPVNPTITSPDDGSILEIANPEVAWSSSGQKGYHFQILDSLGALVWERKETSTLTSLTVTHDLANETDYQFQLAIKNADGLWSDFVSISVMVSYSAPPVPTATVSTGDSSIILAIGNPTSTGTEPLVTHNNIFRRQQGESRWTRIATDVFPDSSFTDYTPASGQTYEYKIRAWGDNNTYSDSAVVTGSVTFIGIWIHDVTNPEDVHHFRADGGGRSNDWSAQAEYMQFAGRTNPVTEFSEHEDDVINANIKVLRDWGDHTALNRLIKAKNILCYRDGRGRRVFGTAVSYPVSDEVWGYTTELTIRRTSFSEEV